MVNEVRIKYFLKLAECLNYHNAADQLYVSQQALSAQISALESDLGTVLFNRTTRSVALTHAGEDFYLLFRPVADEYQQFLDTYSQKHRDTVLRIACMEDMSISGPLADTKDYLVGINPELQVRYTFKTTYQSLLEGLDADEFDIAIIPNAAVPNDNRYRTKICSSGAAYFFISKDYPHAAEIRTLSDVKDAVFFVGTRENPARKKIAADCITEGFRPKFYEPGETPAIERLLIEAGEGVGFGDKHSLLYHNKNLIAIEYKQQPNVLAVWKKEHHGRLMTVFAETLANAMD